MDWHALLEALPTEPDYSRPGFRWEEYGPFEPSPEPFQAGLVGGCWLVVENLAGHVAADGSAVLALRGQAHDVHGDRQWVHKLLYWEPDWDDLQEAICDLLTWNGEPFAAAVRTPNAQAAVRQVGSDAHAA